MSNTLQNYKPIPPLSELSPGICAGWQFQVLILQAVPEDRIGSIMLPEGVKQDELGAAVLARIVDISPTAFISPDWDAVSPGVKPYQCGDLVYTKRYPAGARLRGADGRDYLMIPDKEIIGHRDETAWQTRAQSAA